MDIASWTPEFFIENEDKCKSHLNNEKSWIEIPFLNHANLDNLKDNSLVRFRGMVQDMANPEIYLSKYDVKSDDNDVRRTQNGKYRDVLVLNVSTIVTNHFLVSIFNMLIQNHYFRTMNQCVI